MVILTPMNKLSEILEEVDKEFNEEFNWGIASLINSDKKHPSSIRYPNVIKQFYHSKIKEILTAVIEAAPKEEGGYDYYEEAFNRGRAQTLQIIEDWLKGEEV